MLMSMNLYIRTIKQLKAQKAESALLKALETLPGKSIHGSHYSFLTNVLHIKITSTKMQL